MKKSIFGVMNFLLPARGVFPMHCSANLGQAGDTALFFGLSGTGKTTLSADPLRRLIGDDEHGWSETGIFNIEGGLLRQVRRSFPEKEPRSYHAIRFGAVLEKCSYRRRNRPPRITATSAYTENTRAAYPVEFIANAVIPGVGGHPSHVSFSRRCLRRAAADRQA